MKAELVYQTADKTGEGVIWLKEQKKLLWVDIDSGILHEYISETGTYKTHQLPDVVSSIILSGKDEQEVLLTLRNRIVRYNIENGKITEWVKFNFIRPDFRINDAKVSPEGRIWFGVMHTTNHQYTGQLYCLDPDLTVHKRLDNQCIPNGIVWNVNGDRMYYADSGRHCIEEYIYDKQCGTIVFSKVTVVVPPEWGIPDGMTMDDEGLLWVAHWGGFGVYVWDPGNGRLVDKIEVPVPNVASCTFGGTNENLLFITTAQSGLSDVEIEKYPLSGSLFVAEK
jgi:sugar lactone lactonase YvrE